MKIEIWSDYVCPFCYIGERKLEQALEQLDMKDDVEIIFNAFELDPNAAPSYEANINELIAKKYGMGLAQAKAANENIINAARGVGLNFNFDNLKPTNTFNAHRLSHYAKAEGKLKEYTEIVMKGYFADSMLISDHNTLADLAEKVGLNRDKSMEILSSDAFTEEVRQDETAAHKRGINGVPYFLFDGKEAVSGAQPVETFVQVMRNL